MATESLTVELDAKTSKFDAKIKGAKDGLDGLEESSVKVDGRLAKLGSVAGAAGRVMAQLGTAVLAVNAAITAMVLASAANRRELELLSKQARTSEEDFQALTFATEQYGINAEQIADISKDVADKVGEFSTAGTGAFQDYADVLKLTKEEARQAAIEFQGLSSQEVIGKMVSEMEKANATGDQMTFVLESMGNDLSKLQPLFANNSRELERIKKRFDDVNSSLAITDQQAEGLQNVSNQYSLMTKQMGNATTAISATLAPVMDDFLNDVIEVTPQATQSIIDMINSFLDAENIFSQSGINKEIQASQARMLEFQEELRVFQERDTSYMKDSGEFNNRAIRQLQEKIEGEKQRTAELNAQLEKLEEQEKKLEDVKRLEGGEIGGVTGAEVPEDPLARTADQEAAIVDQIRDRFKTEIQLLEEKYQAEKEILDRAVMDEAERDNLLLELQNDFNDKETEIRERGETERMAIAQKASKREEQLKRQNVQSILAIASSLVDGNSAIGKALFVASQGLAISETFFNTQVAATRALAELGPIAGAPVAAQIETAGYIRIAAIAAQTIGGLAGGGSGPQISVGSGGGDTGRGGNVGAIESQQLSELELSSQDESGTQEIVIRFEADDSDTLLDALAGGLNERTRLGRG